MITVSYTIQVSFVDSRFSVTTVPIKSVLFSQNVNNLVSSGADNDCLNFLYCETLWN